MDAKISGIDGVALCVDNDTFYIMRVEEQDVVTTCDISWITWCLWTRQLSPDYMSYSSPSLSHDQVISMLKHEWAVDRAQRLSRISNDPAEDADLRVEAKLALDELLSNDKTISVQI